ncbi:MAG: DoxX family protein [Burkholderiaceae bacterium]|nr:DoxX family protein [Burkholderiaceae bacterium]
MSNLQTSSFQNALSLAGRALIALLFVPAALSKITGFAGTAGYIASVGLPAASLGVVIAIVIEGLGGLAVLAGFKTRIAALALAVFTLVATFFFHNFWAMPAEAQMMQQLMFFKNLAIVGGLLILAASGPGGWSVDGRKA